MNMYDVNLEDFKVSQSMEFTAELSEVNYDALKEALGAPAEAPVFLKYTVGLPSFSKLHKKKRISKKWAKQGKYRLIRQTIYAEIPEIKAEADGDVMNYTVEVVNEQAERVKQIRELFKG